MPIDLEKDLLPPEELIMDGSASQSDFISGGALMRKILEDNLPITADCQILEVGSAVGRIARQFVNRLSERGGYTGIEIMPALVEWCTQNITGRFPNFSFIHANIYSSHYNPAGDLKASLYRFPFKDESFDQVLLASVFTHMLHSDVSNYLREIRRVLKKGGLCLATFFVYGSDEFKEIHAEGTNPRFLFPVYLRRNLPVSVCSNPQELEEAVAFEKDFMEDKIREAGLEVRGYRPGKWLKSRQNAYYNQDIYILGK